MSKIENLGEIEDIKISELSEDQKEKLGPKMRQIVIETDGSSANIKIAEVAGTFELIGILEGIINQIKK